MKKLFLLVSFIIFLFSGRKAILAQTAPLKQWDKTIGGSEVDMLLSLKQTSDRGFILGGESSSNISGDKSEPCIGLSDYWVVKTDTTGNKIWDRTFGGNGMEKLLSIQQTQDGGYILGGYSSSNISGDKSQASRGGDDFWIVKINSNGNKLWDKTYGGSGADFLHSLVQTTDGGYILGGDSYSGIGGDKSQVSRGNNDFWVIKIDSVGNKLWDKTYGGSGNDGLLSLQETTDGGYILGGYSSSGINGDKSQASKGNDDFWILKINANGNKLWDKAYGGNGSDQIFSFVQTSDGGIILGGNSQSGVSGDKSQPAIGGKDFWIVKTDSIGDKIWDKTHGSTGDDYLRAIEKTTDGGYILGGYQTLGFGASGLGSAKYGIVKLDQIGNKSWDKKFLSSINGPDFLTAVHQTSDQGFIIGGASASDISGDKSQLSKGMADFWIIKLGAEITGFEETETDSGISAFPNPAKGKINLVLDGLTTPEIELKIVDLLGKIVLQYKLEVVNKQVSKEIKLPISKGMYLLQLETKDRIITRKILVE